jgi:hypothetical protein
MVQVTHRIYQPERYFRVLDMGFVRERVGLFVYMELFWARSLEVPLTDFNTGLTTFRTRTWQDINA